MTTSPFQYQGYFPVYLAKWVRDSTSYTHSHIQTLWLAGRIVHTDGKGRSTSFESKDKDDDSGLFEIIVFPGDTVCIDGVTVQPRPDGWVGCVVAFYKPRAVTVEFSKRSQLDSSSIPPFSTASVHYTDGKRRFIDCPSPLEEKQQHKNDNPGTNTNDNTSSSTSTGQEDKSEAKTKKFQKRWAKKAAKREIKEQAWKKAKIESIEQKEVRAPLGNLSSP